MNSNLIRPRYLYNKVFGPNTGPKTSVTLSRAVPSAHAYHGPGAGGSGGAAAMVLLLGAGAVYVTYKTLQLMTRGILAAQKSIAIRINARRGNLYAMIERGRATYWSKYRLFVGTIRGNKRAHKVRYVRNRLNRLLGNTNNKKILNIKNKLIKLVSIQAQPNGTYKNNNGKIIHNRNRAGAYGKLIITLIKLYIDRVKNTNETNVKNFVISLLALYFIIDPVEYSDDVIQNKSSEILKSAMESIKPRQNNNGNKLN